MTWFNRGLPLLALGIILTAAGCSAAPRLNKDQRVLIYLELVDADLNPVPGVKVRAETVDAQNWFDFEPVTRTARSGKNGRLRVEPYIISHRVNYVTWHFDFYDRKDREILGDPALTGNPPKGSLKMGRTLEGDPIYRFQIR